MSGSTRSDAPTLRELWRQFLPLSVSDVTMAAGDPMITATLARMPNPLASLAAIGVAKAVAVFFESPIIMMLHASNALAPSREARAALRRFMLIACVVLSSCILLLAATPLFGPVVGGVMGLSKAHAALAREALLFLVLWPASIGWRRYYQGLLVRHGQARSIARAGIFRLGVVFAILLVASAMELGGVRIAGAALIGGVLAEAAYVTVSARVTGAASLPSVAESTSLPRDLRGVWRFYWPLANSMLVVWGGRALLVAAVARATDATLALAAWPAAWGFTLVIANATRMVQQVVIRNRGRAPERHLVLFAASVGAVFAAILTTIGATPLGEPVLRLFVGNNPELVAAMKPVVLLCAAVPFLVSLQNAVQGLLIGDGRTGAVNAATWAGTAVLLGSALAAVRAGFPGASAAAFAMSAALLTEMLILAATRRKMATRRAQALARSAA